MVNLVGVIDFQRLCKLDIVEFALSIRKGPLEEPIQLENRNMSKQNSATRPTTHFGFTHLVPIIPQPTPQPFLSNHPRITRPSTERTDINNAFIMFIETRKGVQDLLLRVCEFEQVLPEQGQELRKVDGACCGAAWLG